ncbi:hypothetical protein [Methylotetracoccus oryzae]|uniref:hypothetical protein n=1 Tax=Methylotetracoccus oryzae TaxID=1919059 RepID=UPI001118C655|nr:hypothetical protein [Methylotetracoccus oryzae]
MRARGTSRVAVISGAAGASALLLLALTSAAEADVVDFLYIESNVGTSSGGHVALRVGEEVFHYQHEDEGLLVLARDDWSRFRTTYNDRDNRNIHVARLPFSPADVERVRDRFVHLYLVQHGHLDFLEALDRDAALLTSVESGHAPALARVGLFRAGASAEFDSLHTRIAEQRGPHYLSQEGRALEARIRSLDHGVPDVGPWHVDPERHAPYPDTFEGHYRNLASQWVALQVLKGAWSLHPQALLDGAGDDVRAGLKPGERERLRELARALEASSVSLLGSARIDAGGALLLALARLAAVQRSLMQNRLLLLNPWYGLDFPELPASPETAVLPLAEANLRQQFAAARREYFALDEADEASLNVLENAAARLDAVRHEVRTGRRRAYPAERMVPSAAGPVGGAIPLIASPRPLADRRVGFAEQQHRVFRDKMKAVYGYHLIRRNCATELVRALSSALPTDRDQERLLGGNVDPVADLAFIPFLLYEKLARRLAPDRRFMLPSYRNRALAAFSARGNPLWIRLAEATTATSALYEPRPGDTRFLFFTEDWPWLRPLLGSLNLGYGLLNAGGGVVTAAFDKGERVSEGLRGVLFSLPELAFFNIRKGSFESRRLPVP